MLNETMARGQIQGGVVQGIGELPLDGPAPALANAIADALGVEPRVIPITPERLMNLVEGDASSG